MFTLTHISFQSILLKILLRYDLDHTFCWLIVNTEFSSIPKFIFYITFLEPFHFCSFLSFFLNFAWFLPALVLRYRLVILSRFENTLQTTK
jgi:hypothetical protein